jgi:drug/metabolite transporter superfamily protein YnfA
MFTVLGEWWVEKKAIERDTWIGMVLALGGIALCVVSKQ